MEFFLQKTVNHPMLTSDPDLKLFLESDSFSLEIKHRKHDSSHQPGWLANLAGPRFVETDEFFDSRKVSLDTLEGQLKALQSSLAAASKARKALSQSLSDLSTSLQALSTCDLSKPVRNTFDRLAGLHKQCHLWSEEQSKNELETLITTIESYGRLTNSVRLTFSGRIKSWEKFQFSLNHLRKIQANHDKIKRAASSDQSTALMYSLAELEEAERRAHEARNEFADVSKLIKAEFQRFDKEKVEDFKSSICKFVDGLTERQREIVKIWQEYYQLLQVLSTQNVDANNQNDGQTKAGQTPQQLTESLNGINHQKEGVKPDQQSNNPTSESSGKSPTMPTSSSESQIKRTYEVDESTNPDVVEEAPDHATGLKFSGDDDSAAAWASDSLDHSSPPDHNALHQAQDSQSSS